MEDTPRTDMGQVKSEEPPPATLLALALSCGGGYIPPRGSGAFSTIVWGRLLGKDPRTIRRWIAELSIPVRKAGDMLMIDTDALLDRLPWLNEDIEE